MPDIYDPLDKEFLAGIQEANQHVGIDTFVFTGISSSNTRGYIRGENNIYELPFASKIDGIIFASNRFDDNRYKEELCHRIEESGIPFVVTEEHLGNIKGVSVNQRKCIYDITDHLIECHSYRDILCLTGPVNNHEATERAAGYADAMKQHGLNYTNQIIYGDFWQESAFALAEKIALGEIVRPQAIVCTNDIMAINLCQHLQNYGIQIPDDIAITGYDGSLYALLTTPAITTICGSDRCLGMLALKKLHHLIGIILNDQNISLHFDPPSSPTSNSSLHYLFYFCDFIDLDISSK